MEREVVAGIEEVDIGLEERGHRMRQWRQSWILFHLYLIGNRCGRGFQILQKWQSYHKNHLQAPLLEITEQHCDILEELELLDKICRGEFILTTASGFRFILLMQKKRVQVLVRWMLIIW